MRAHFLQHVPFEGLGSIEPWLEQKGYKISNTELFSSGALPAIEDVDFLIVLGGPMSVNDEAAYPWLVEEKEFIRAFIKTQKPVLGICLGAQLIAQAMGAKVLPGKHKEIGWFSIEAVEPISPAVFSFPSKAEVFHWHGETFTLPEGAIHLAKSEGCENQAFQLGVNVIGLQFHLETTPLSAQAILEHCRDELVEGPFVQTEHAILSVAPERYAAINGLMAKVLEYLHSK